MIGAFGTSKQARMLTRQSQVDECEPGSWVEHMLQSAVASLVPCLGWDILGGTSSLRDMA